ncbi:MAG: hypothetical protein HY842_00595 [Bacteroidetes bacterium]|nr:hypothetical protein [Bacteroidota bacterium]
MKRCTIFFSFFLPIFAHAQPAILLTNPSFEGTPGYGQLPGGWMTCAFNRESPPDTHPVENGRFGVVQLPQEGRTYLGMVVRDNQTTEFVSQKPVQPLRAGRCYTFSLYLCKSEHLHSLSRSDNRQQDFNQPAVLRAWGGQSHCGKKQLLATSPAIDHTVWRQYSFRVQPLDSLSYLTFEAYFAEGAPPAYNGNLLLDNVSPIVPLDCQTQQPLVDVDTLTVPAYVPHQAELLELNGILEENCAGTGFPAGMGKLSNTAKTGLMEVAMSVRNRPAFRLEVGLVAADRKLSRQRAKALQRIFKKAGLSGSRYIVTVVSTGAEMTGWRCGQGEIWLRATKFR